MRFINMNLYSKIMFVNMMIEGMNHVCIHVFSSIAVFAA